MSPWLIQTSVAVFDAAAGFGLGWIARPLWSKHKDADEMSAYMERVVNQEGAEEYRTAMRLRLHDANRRTMRLDGGAPATVHRMRRRRRTKRLNR